MLRQLLSPSRSDAPPSSGSVQQQLEAVTAERDFFREKYAEQIEGMDELKVQLKESQRVIDRLRSQVLDLEVERSRLAREGASSGSIGIISGGDELKNPRKACGSSDTSLTSATCEDSTKSLSASVRNDVGSMGASVSGDKENSDYNDSSSSTSPVEKEFVGEDGVNTNSHTSLDDKVRDQCNLEADDAAGNGMSTDDESIDGEEESSADEKDEADQIRAKAEKMLIWANYQTARRTPTKEQSNRYDNDAEDEDYEMRARTPPPYSTPTCSISNIPSSLNKSKSLLDDSSSLGSQSRNKPAESDSEEESVNGSNDGSQLFAPPSCD